MKNGPYEMVVAPPNYPGKRYRGRYCYEHILIWWLNTGEMPDLGEVVHHRDENKRNNTFTNLEKKTVAKHTSDHHPSAEMMTINCFWCQTPYDIRASLFRDRAKAYGHTNFCCSRSCQVSKQQREIIRR